jgi:hypothetical protein
VAKRAQVVLVFATVLGVNPMTVELILRYLAKAGLVPQGLPGHRSVHYLAVHLKNLILALAAYLPSEAVEAVRVLNDLSCNTNALLNMTTPGEAAPVERGLLFGDWIIQEIEARVIAVEADHIVIDPEEPPFLDARQICMSVKPARAWNMRPNKPSDVKSSFDRYHFDHFASANWRAEIGKGAPVLSRQTTFTVELLIAAGDLLADTLAAQATTPIPDPVPGRTGEGDATPETTKAAGPGSHDGLQLEHPASRTRKRRPLNKAQLIASQGSKQLSLATANDHSGDRVRGAGSSTQTSKGAHHGTAWTDAASP